jgi:transcriptional regulator of stress and heat shock response
MLISDAIAQLIEQMLSESGGSLELRRNDFAGKIGCVPSQINYVITSRFTPELGYIIESRRGGGGYIRIVKKQLYKNEYLMHFFQAIGEELDETAAAAFITNLSDNLFITDREEKIIRAAITSAVSNKNRADIIRQIILAVIE